MKTVVSLVFVLVLTGVFLTLALAQRATPEERGAYPDDPKYGTLHLKSNLGSFKTHPHVPTGKAEGRFELTFSGSLLVSNLEGNIEVSEGLRKEYEGMDRQVYHGTGRAVVTGKWRALQWFGSDMEGVWYGSGLINVIGEFDKDLKTGEYWYNDPERKGVWPSTMWTLHLPEQGNAFSRGVNPTRRGEGGN